MAQLVPAARSLDPPAEAVRPEPRAALLDRSDLLWMLAFMAVGLGLRLMYFSGFGLADDQIFRGSIAQIQTRLIWGNMTYRVVWWLPTLVLCRLFGLTEQALIYPITATATLGIALVYVLGKALSGKTAAVIAALLVVVQPLDFAWSTMLANDIMLSFVSALTMLFVLRAIQHDDPVWKHRFWILAAVALWSTSLAKVSGVVLMPVIAIICWMHRRRLGRGVLDFLVCATVLFGLTSVVYWLFADDPLAPLHSELIAQPMSSNEFWVYPHWLFLPDNWGGFVYSLYPALLIVLALGSRWLRITTSAETWWWLLLTFVGLQLAIRWENGAWFTAFRNVRHGHVLVYPLVLTLAGYLAHLRGRHGKLLAVLLPALVLFSLWQCVGFASRTKSAFADRRNACHYLASLPAKTIYADGSIQAWCTTIPGITWAFVTLRSPDAAGRTAELAAVTSGYLVTGGGREPVYGPISGSPTADEVPAGRWTLLTELPGPPPGTPWRPEPLRIWEAVEPAAAPGQG